MRKKMNLAALLLAAALLGACGGQKQAADSASQSESAGAESTGQAEDGKTGSIDLADGVYTVEFKTDSSMFKVNESKDGKGVLTVRDGEAVLHISLTSKNIVNLYLGTAEEAKEDEAGWLQPTVDTVTYSDGLSEEVNGFDVPVPAIGEEFDLALIGKKGTWYDHKVSVENPVAGEAEDAGAEDASVEAENSVGAADAQKAAGETADLADGTYTCEVTLQGGSGRASVDSPATILVKDGEVTADIIWSSPNYEYMLVDDVQYEPIQTEGNSEFQIPVTLDEDVAVSALTVAMSQPHLIDYTLHFDSATVSEVTK